MYRLLTVLLLLVVPVLGQAADTITVLYDGPAEVIQVSPARKALRTKLLGRLNARRAAQTPPLPPISLEKFEAQEIVNMMQAADRDAAALNTTGDADFCTIFTDPVKTTNTQRNQIIAIGGGASPCP